MGLQEQKKISTRQALTAAATKLFLERGFDSVTITEIAAEARTAVTTLFTYFPEGKDALIFGREDRLTAFQTAVEQRPEGQSVLDATEEFITARAMYEPGRNAQQESVESLILETPALRAYARKKWVECEPFLAEMLAQATGGPMDASRRALARFALEVPDLVAHEAGSRDMIRTTFAHLRKGWGLG